MAGTVSAAEANRNFSALLRRVQQGERVTITSRGRPVAEIAPPAAVPSEGREAAWQALLGRLRGQEPTIVGRWSREELYEPEEPGPR